MQQVLLFWKFTAPQMVLAEGLWHRVGEYFV